MCSRDREARQVRARPCYVCQRVSPGDLLIPLLLVSAIAIARLASALRGIPWAQSRSWWFALATVVGGGLIAFLLAPEMTGVVAFALVAVLLIAPTQLMSAAQDALRRGAERRGVALARIASTLHPSAALRERARLHRLITDLRAGREPAAEIQHFSAQSPEMAELLPALIAHLHGDTQAVLEHLGDPQTRQQLLASGLGLAYLRAIATTTDSGEAIAAAFHAFGSADPNLQQPEQLALVSVFLPALVGDVATTRYHAELLRAYLGPAEPVIACALAIARAGRREAALQTLDEAALRHRGDRIASQHIKAYRRVIEECVDRPPSPSQALAEILNILRRRAPHLAELAALEGRGAERLPLTWSIGGVLIAVHVLVSLTGDPLDPVHLYGWGALATSLFSAAEGWRLVTSTLLHAGLLHLIFNLVGLRFFGRFVEPLFGRARMAVIYIAAGVLAALAVAIIAGHDTPQILVGASGAILGLGGATLAASLRRPTLRKSSRGKAQIRGLVLIFGLQLAFDALAAAVSSTAHIAGFILGFLFGLILTPPAPSMAPPSAQPEPDAARPVDGAEPSASS